MRVRTILLAAALALGLAPTGTRAADLVVWWHKGRYPAEDAAARELVAAFERKTGKTVELVLIPEWEWKDRLEPAVATGKPPDLARGDYDLIRTDRWAAAGVLADLSDVILPIKDRFFPGLLDQIRLANPQTGEPTFYSVPVGQAGLYIHVWTSLLERAGFKLADIPKEWEPFWSFWCDKVQPAVRAALGREDIWGTGLAMSRGATDTFHGVEQFMIAHSAPLWSGTSKLLDDPTFRRNLVSALADYTAPWRKGCVPPDAVTWRDPNNNAAFLEQRIVMTTNGTLSIPGALREIRPNDYFRNTATIEWPLGPSGRIFPLLVLYWEAVVFRDGRNVAVAKEFLRLLLDEGQLGASLEAAQGRLLPTMPELAGRSFWMDLSDPHRRPAVEQLVSPSIPVGGPARLWVPQWEKVSSHQVLADAVHRVAADGLTPEQAVDEAIARVKQILGE